MEERNVDTKSLNGFVVVDLTHLDPWNCRRQEQQNRPAAQSTLDEHFSKSCKYRQQSYQTLKNHITSYMHSSSLKWQWYMKWLNLTVKNLKGQPHTWHNYETHFLVYMKLIILLILCKIYKGHSATMEFIV